MFGRAYFEATLLGTGGGSGAKNVKGIRIGWAETGACLDERLGDGKDSFGFDGNRHKVYFRAAEKKRKAQPLEEKEKKTEREQDGSGVPTAPLERKEEEDKKEGETEGEEGPLSPMAGEPLLPPNPGLKREETFDFEGLCRSFMLGSFRFQCYFFDFINGQYHIFVILHLE